LPGDGSSPITGFTVKVRHVDGITFSEEPISCDGTDSIIFAALSCQIPISSLFVKPYALPYGSGIYAKVSAINIVGSSTYSLEGNGAIILTKPDSPI
jgi:hypothetical protein